MYRRRETLRAIGPEVVFFGSKVLPIGLDFGRSCLRSYGIVSRARVAGLAKQLADGAFYALVLAFAEMVVANVAVRVDQVDGGPIVIVEGVPDTIVAIYGY